MLVGTAHIDATMEEIGKWLAKVEASLQQVTQNKANIDKAFENLLTFSTKLETLTSQVAAMQNQLETSISAMDGNIKGQLVAFQNNMMSTMKQMLEEQQASLHATWGMANLASGGGQRLPPSPTKTPGKGGCSSLPSPSSSCSKA